MFDVNDFDETNPGPFEWDVKRLAASLEIAGRGRGFDVAANRAIVLQAVRTYRETVRRFSRLPKLDIWYAKLDSPAVLALWGNDAGAATLASLRKAVANAGSKDRLKARNKLTKLVDGELEFRTDPPLLVPIDDVFHEPEHAASLEAALRAALVSYRKTLRPTGEPCSTASAMWRRPERWSGWARWAPAAGWPVHRPGQR